MQKSLTFEEASTARPKPSGIDVLSKLQHFALITYAIDPSRCAGLIHDRFALTTVTIDGVEKALLSVVPFLDVDFTSAVYPCPNFTIGQTNYRIYVIDKATGEQSVWFLGTTLDSWTCVVPHFLWNLPWYGGHIRFDCSYDAATGLYRQYAMKTEARWAPASVTLVQDGSEALCLAGFPDIETGLVCLTHPLTGFYYRRDGQLGSYRVWHKPLAVKPATLTSASFGLLARLGLVTEIEQQTPHSVLVEPLTEFTIYLPPQVVR